MKKVKRKTKKVPTRRLSHTTGLNLKPHDIIIIGGGFCLIILMSMMILGSAK